jgi:hypothetical protein
VAILELCRQNAATTLTPAPRSGVDRGGRDIFVAVVTGAA